MDPGNIVSTVGISSGNYFLSVQVCLRFVSLLYWPIQMVTVAAFADLPAASFSS